MYGQEKIKPYSAEGEKVSQVEEMFDNIAPTYDLLNHRLSWNIDKYWRKKAISTLSDNMTEEGTPRILDVATGTGDLALQMAKKMPKADITGIDISDGMLQIARQKAEKENRPMTFAKEDCDALSYPDDSFDAVTAAFGIRNFQNLASAYSYLNKTIEAFPQGETMMQILKNTGFSETHFKRLTFGICTMYIAYK